MSKKKKNTKDNIIKIILIVIIILLLVHNCCVIKKENDKKIPTGNVDIIEITCNKGNTCEINDKKIATDESGEDNNKKTNNQKYENSLASAGIANNNSDQENSSGGNQVPSTPADESTEENPDLIVYDKEVTWNGATQAKIFTNSMYHLDDVIAPESHNTYKFVIKNKTNYTLKYNINFVETNNDNINMKYKLKKENNYINSSYSKPNNLKQTGVIIAPGKNDTYYLDWKWISSDDPKNDTKVGAKLNSKYDLTIEVEAESV